MPCQFSQICSFSLAFMLAVLLVFAFTLVLASLSVCSLNDRDLLCVFSSPTVSSNFVFPAPRSSSSGCCNLPPASWGERKSPYPFRSLPSRSSNMESLVGVDTRTTRGPVFLSFVLAYTSVAPLLRLE